MFEVPILLKIIGVSASGALAPGPLTASSVAVGVREGWKGGLNIAFGHMIIEFPLVLAIAFGLGSFFQINFVKLLLGSVGGVFLLFFSFLTLKDALHVKELNPSKTSHKYNSSILVGVALTAFNPYFIAWWISVGTALLLESISVITLPAIILFYFAHVWLDYFWLILMSKVGSFSKLNLRVYKIILTALAIMILYFGIELLYKILLG